MTDKKSLTTGIVRRKIILDLCGGTGSWSRPYKDAGYDVRIITTPKYDVTKWRDYPDLVELVESGKVYGVLAAPPCTMFSMARTVAKTPRDMKSALKVVNACLDIIAECQYDNGRLAFWALENPKARLRWFLGKPLHTFQPMDYGDPHSKKTDIWGYFNADLKKNPVELNEKQRKQSHLNSRELPQLPDGYVCPPDMNKRAAQRSITPEGFANAFFKANR